VRQILPDEGLPIEDRTQTNITHHLDFAVVKHVHFLLPLDFAVAFVCANLEHPFVLLAAVRRQLDLWNSSKGDEEVTVDPFKPGFSFAFGDIDCGTEIRVSSFSLVVAVAKCSTVG
jgi:hypothetical protein